MIEIAKEAEEPDAFEKHFQMLPAHDARFGRINETKAAKDLVLTWKGLELLYSRRPCTSTDSCCFCCSA